MKVIVTGSSGRIGSVISKRLRKSSQTVGIDIQPGPLTDVRGDIADKELIDRQLEGVDAIVHTAAYHAPHVDRISDHEFRRINVAATETLLEAAIRAGTKRFVFTSSTSVYGEALCPQDRAVWVTEDLCPIPRDIYDRTKLAAEDLCRQAVESGLETIVLRMSRCFPEQDDLMAIYRLYRGVDAQDVARAHQLALTVPLPDFQIVNISAESPFTRSDCSGLWGKADDIIRRHYPWVDGEFAKRGWNLPNYIDRVYVVEKAKAILGYQPKRNFKSIFDGQSEMDSGQRSRL